jgi:hypothetical protein
VGESETAAQRCIALSLRKGRAPTRISASDHIGLCAARVEAPPLIVPTPGVCLPPASQGCPPDAVGRVHGRPHLQARGKRERTGRPSSAPPSRGPPAPVRRNPSCPHHPSSTGRRFGLSPFHLPVCEGMFNGVLSACCAAVKRRKFSVSTAICPARVSVSLRSCLRGCRSP